MTTSRTSNLQIPFKRPSRERQARQFATRLWEAPQARLSKTGTYENMPFKKLKELVEVTYWLVAEAGPGAEECEAIMALLFLSHDSRVALVHLHGTCTRALTTKMRSADRSRIFEDEEYCKYFKWLQLLTSLMSCLFQAQNPQLQTALLLLGSLALKHGMLSAGIELLAAAGPKAVKTKPRLKEMELPLVALDLPLQLANHISSTLLNQRVLSKPLLHLLLETMASSNFAEHSARVLVLAMEAFKVPMGSATGGIEPSWSGSTYGDLRDMVLDRFDVLCSCIVPFHIFAGDGPRALAAIKSILSGPCLQYTLAGVIISLLASADGGTLYGMTTPLPVIAPTLQNVVELWHWLFAQSPPIKLQLYSRRAVRRVCLRMLHVARMSVVTVSAAQGLTPVQGPRQRLLWGSTAPLPKSLSLDASCDLALAALRGYALTYPRPLVQNLRLGGRKWAGPGTATKSPGAVGTAAGAPIEAATETTIEAAAQAAVEYWREAGATLHTLLNHGKALNDRVRLRVLDVMPALAVAVGDWIEHEPVPPPSPSLTAALANGYVPLLEMTLRALAPKFWEQSPNYGIATLLDVFSSTSRMAALLSYGDPHEVTSLLATGAKLLKRLMHWDAEEQLTALEVFDGLDWTWRLLKAQAMGSSPGKAVSAAGGPSCSTAQLHVGRVDVPNSACGKDSCTSSAGRSEGTPQLASYPSQAVSLTSACWRLWLPPLTTLAKQPLDDFWSEEDLLNLSSKWVQSIPAMVAAMEMEEGRLQHPGCESSSRHENNINSKGHGFGWRCFLLQEWDVVGQLGTFMWLMLACDVVVFGVCYPDMLEMAYNGLGCLLSTVPGEVAAGLKDGRLPVLSAKQLFRPGAVVPKQPEIERWQVLLSRLQKLAKGKEVAVEASAAQGFWASLPATTKIGSMLANCPAATMTASKATETSTSHGRLPGRPQPPRLCPNPGCDNLAGDSEATLPLKACGGCGAVWYCRRECQAAHWRAGHKTECAMGATRQPQKKGAS